MIVANVTFQDEPVNLLGSEIKVGDHAPNFTVLSNDLKDVTLDDYKGNHPNYDKAIEAAKQAE